MNILAIDQGTTGTTALIFDQTARVVKKAYCDWERYKKFKAAMHEAAFELIEIPHLRQSGKNSADIRMVVDALDLCYTVERRSYRGRTTTRLSIKDMRSADPPATQPRVRRRGGRDAKG